MRATGKMFAAVLCIALIVANGSAVIAAETLTATPSISKVLVNGKEKSFEAYNIGGNNYFKLRDLAMALNGSNKQFYVGYDNATKAVTLTSGKAYNPVGGEMAKGDGKAKAATPTASGMYKDGKALGFTVYAIEGSNFFKLRDLMSVFDIAVTYDSATKNIAIDTAKSFSPEPATDVTTNQSVPVTLKDGLYESNRDDVGTNIAVRGEIMSLYDGIGGYTLVGDRGVWHVSGGGESEFRVAGDSIFIEMDMAHWDNDDVSYETVEVEFVWTSGNSWLDRIEIGN